MIEKLQSQLADLDKLFDQLAESRQRAQQEVILLAAAEKEDKK
ncbi:hypothetical protein [Halalkalibacter oceani]